MVTTDISGSNDSNSIDFQKRSNLSEVVTLIGGWALTAIYSATYLAIAIKIGALVDQSRDGTRFLEGHTSGRC